MNPNLIRALLLVSVSSIFQTANAFEESPAVPERLLPGAAERQRALPEHFAAVGKAGWEDRLPQVPELTGELIEASRDGKLDKVKTLIAAGALPNGADALGERPLAVAVAGEHVELARLLLQRGASPNVKSAKGLTPLGMAAAAGNPAMVRLLLKAGAVVDDSSDNRATPLHEAVRFDHPAIIRQLMAANPEMARYDREGLHPLALAASLGRLACLASIFESGVEADLPDRKGLTALFWARRYDQALAEVILVENGARREAWPILVD